MEQRLGFGVFLAPHHPVGEHPTLQLQRDLDEYIAFYNRERAHQGYRTQGRTPFQTFSEGVAQMRREEVKPKAA